VAEKNNNKNENIPHLNMGKDLEPLGPKARGVFYFGAILL
jgi:hypothetical protein